MTTVYLDHAASTPPDPRVVAGMASSIVEFFANPHSRSHRLGRAAHQAIEHARERVARLLGADPRDVIFTSGATESNNLAIRGASRSGSPASNAKRSIVSAPTEHPSVLRPLQMLERSERATLTLLGVDNQGALDPRELETRIDGDTWLVTLMWANNEIGCCHDIATIGHLARKAGAVYHCDATQAVGKVAIDVTSLPIDLLSFSGHKIYGPKGIGVLWVRPGIDLEPLAFGGDQERGLRPGTANTSAIVGLGIACEIAQLELDENALHLRAISERLRQALVDNVPGCVVISPPESTTFGIVNVAFDGVDAENLLDRATNLAASPGAACHPHDTQVSPVIEAIGVTRSLRTSCLRFSPGRFTSRDDIDHVVDQIARAVSTLRPERPVAIDKKNLVDRTH